MSNSNIVVPKASLLKEKCLYNKPSLYSVCMDILAAADEGHDCMIFPTTLSHDVRDKLKEKGITHQYVTIGGIMKSLVTWN